MSHAKAYVAATWISAPWLQLGGLGRVDTSSAWAGYDARQADNGGKEFNLVEADFDVIPKYSGTYAQSQPNAESQWVGTGGDTSQAILQGGVLEVDDANKTAYNYASNYGLVAENYYPNPPCSTCGAAVSLSLALSPGDQMYVSMDNSYNASKYTVFWEDMSTGQYTSWTRPVQYGEAYGANSSGDCVHEEALGSVHYQFQDPHFTSCFLQYGTAGGGSQGQAWLSQTIFTENDLVKYNGYGGYTYEAWPNGVTSPGDFTLTIFP